LFYWSVDGHTYDRRAIEKWISFMRGKDLRPTSPKTGEELEHLHLIPNHNLKRLLGDMLSEGRADTLYCRSTSDQVIQEVQDTVSKRRQNEVGGEPVSSKSTVLAREKTLLLKCLGPNDSDWNNRSFRVMESEGCVGGRRRGCLNDPYITNFVIFNEVTVSRIHFEIRYDKERRSFCIRDLGSAVGTFVRMKQKHGLKLNLGAMFMIGKHQMIVTKSSLGAQDCKNSLIVDNPKHILANNLTCVQEDTVSTRNDFSNEESSPTLVGNSDPQGESEVADVEVGVGSISLDNKIIQEEQKEEINSVASEADGYETSLSPDCDQASTTSDNENDENKFSCDYTCSDAEINGTLCTENDLVIECYGPEGSPLQHKEFTITQSRGATIGRKLNNTISFTHDNDGELVGIDGSVSAEHANILYGEEIQGFELFDGSRYDEKGSTNGTWIRLSESHAKSDFYPVEDLTELLIGVTRFRVTVDEQIVEREVPYVCEENINA